jgi:cell division septal protein FtsQ
MRSEVKVLLATLLFGAGVAWGPRAVDGMARMQTFRVDQVDVVGVRFLTKDAVVAQLELGPYASVWGDTEAWVERLLRHPMIRAARVRRRLPDGLRVEVEERVPVALAAAPTLEPVDAEGHRLPIDPARFSLDLPVLFADRLPPADAAVFPAEVRGLAAEMDHLDATDSDFARRISSIRGGPGGSIVARLVSPEVEVVLPSQAPLGRLKEAQQALSHAISVDPGRLPRVVDLTYAGQVVVRRDR